MPIAVIGLGSWYPGSQSPKELWENILSRRKQFRRIPRSRLPLDEYFDEDKKSPDKSYARMAAVIDGFCFDWSARRIPLSTYLATDIVHWLALETALQAVQDAGFSDKNFPRQGTGVIVGNSLTGEYTRSYTLRLRWPYVRKAFLAAARSCDMSPEEIRHLEDVLESYYKSPFPAPDEDTLAGGLSNTIAGRICNYLNLDGGGYTVDGACSSSLLAITTAASAISSGDLTMAMAGGVDISIDPFEVIGFSKTGALTPDEMHVYDRRGNGFLPGEGCGFVILKSYADALRDGNYIYAVLHGWGISSDGNNAAITAPSVSGQALALKRAYEHTGYGIDSLHLIEGHGTGTAVGDRVELEAIATVANNEMVQRNRGGRYCGITSLKSIVGHCKAASGVGGFIKAVMAVNQRICPPTAGCRYPSTAFDETALCLYPIQMGKLFHADETLRAGVSAMGFGGINCHVTIESADPPSSKIKPQIDERALMASAQENDVFVFSADNANDLVSQLEALLKMVEDISFAELTDLAFVLGHRVNSNQTLRAAFSAGHPVELAKKLGNLKSILKNQALKLNAAHHDASETIWIGNTNNRPRVGMLFPGQGSQKLNMGRVLVERFGWARDLVQTADRLSQEWNATPLSQVMYPPVDQAESTQQIESWFQSLSQTANAQPAICLASIMWYRFLRELGVEPLVVGGHSLGEATAFFSAGAFDENTLLRFAFLRGQAMTLPLHQAGAMLSLQCTYQEAMNLLQKVNNGYIALANINAPKQMVASGSTGSIELLSQLAKAHGVSTNLLPVSNAFHCQLSAPVAEKLAKAMPLPHRLMNRKSRLFSSMGGQEILDGHDLNEHFVRQVISQVNFEALVQSMAKEVDIFLEVGPGRVLTGLVEATTGADGPPCMPIESSPLQVDDLNRLLAHLFVHGVEIKWGTLYENRLVREFVSPDRRSFLVNPCERPLKLAARNQRSSKTQAQISIAPALPELADLPHEMLLAYWKKRGGFLADIIKADIKHSQPDVCLCNEEHHPHQSLDPKTSPHDSSPNLAGSPSDSLYELVAQLTGFPRETLTPQSRLLDDLNLDSIKSGDLIARYAAAQGLSGQLDPSGLTNASLQEIIDQVSQFHLDPNQADKITRWFSHSHVLQILIDQTSRLTRTPAAQIAIDALIGKDLDIGEDELQLILRATSEELKVDANIDLKPVLRRNLSQLADILIRIAHVRKEKERGSSFTIPHSWVRELRVDLIEKERPALPSWHGRRTEDQWSHVKVLTLTDHPQDAVCTALTRRLQDSGAAVEWYSFDQAKFQGAFQDLCGYSHFVVFLPRTTDESEDFEKNLIHIINRLSYASLPPPASSGPRRRNCLVFIQFGGGYFGTGPEAVALSRCCATALAKSVYLERDDLKTRVIDLNPKIPAHLMAEKIIVEMETPDNFVEVGYDLSLVRRTPVATSLHPDQYLTATTSWSSQDVILVTGGAKGITAECAFAVGRATGARMALIGRTPINASESESSENSKIIETLKRYQAHGLVARYYSCDVCDREVFSATIKRIQQEMGKITGIIHGAGLNMPRPVQQVTAEQALKEVAPKVIGALNLLHELAENPPKLIIGLTSVIGITGMPGNSWYAFSNEALDLILHQYKEAHPGIRTLSVAYSIWRDEGMGVRLGSVIALKQKGIDAIPTDEGANRFVRLFFSDPGTHQVLITARLADFDTLRMESPPPIHGARFLEKAIHFMPGVESAYQVHLSLTEDLYLQDHCYNGSHLFPAVFGLEAMAQVIAQLTGLFDWDRLRVENLHLNRPIVVDPENGADIIIWAQMQEEFTAKTPLCVRAGIFKLGADAKSDFFSADFYLNPTDLKPQSTLDLPQGALDLHAPTDLYRKSFLFQGPRFQRIDEVYDLERFENGSGFTLLSLGKSNGPAAKLAFAKAGHCRFMIGDPFIRDCLLQSAALLIPQDTALPIFIRRWEICPNGAQDSNQSRIYVRTELESIKNQEVQTLVRSFHNSGKSLERIEGYRLKILQHHQDYPSVADLLQPDERDTRDLSQCLARLEIQFHIACPILLASFLPMLHNLPKETRRARELPLLERAVECWQEKNQSRRLKPVIHWEFSGKPVVSGLDGVVDVSLSHDDQYCIAAIGSWSVGCDITPLMHRSRQQWTAILGPLGAFLVDGQMGEIELDREGTAFWSAREVLHKMGVRDVLSMKIERRAEDGILFLCDTDRGEVKILAFWKILTRGVERILAMSVSNARKALAADMAPEVDYPGYEALFDRQHYKIIDGGPQGQGIFIYRFPVTFMPAGQLSRSIYYSHYFFWAGTVREASAWPVLGRIAQQFATGKWGGVTNYATLKVLGEASTHDLVEVWMWASGNGGPHNSVLDLTYDFRKVLPSGGYERLAWLEQQTTWVRIIDHGRAQVEPYPEYYAAFLDDMLPRYDAPNVPEKLPESLGPIHQIEEESHLYVAPAGPTVTPKLYTQIIETSLEDANIVGNIYFANYYAWQGRVRDHYFFRLIPDYFRGIGENGELICLNCRVDHLREAMPFERIQITMALQSLSNCRATLHFEYYKIAPNGHSEKLGVGTQEVVWVKRDSHMRPITHPFPSAVHSAFLNAIEGKDSYVNCRAD